MTNVDEIRHRLLELHRVLIDEVRSGYERIHGKTTAGQFLDVLVNHEDFTWIQPFTSLIVELDDDAVDPPAWTGRARALLRPDVGGDEFQRRYDELVQRSADVLVAHGAAMRAIGTQVN